MNATIASTQAILVSLLRASSLPLAFACPGSIRDTATRINASNEAARTGSAAHKCSESLPSTGSIDWDNVDLVAAEYNCDCNELRYLCAKATKLWSKVKDSFPGALTEVAVEYPLQIGGLTITGTIDGIAISGDVARLYDFKFGRLDTDYYHQMMAYGSMVLLQFPQLREVTVTILWARTDQLENYTISRENAESWMRSLESEVVEWNGILRPNDKCVHCPRFYECDAANGLTRAAVASIEQVDIDQVAKQIALMEPDELIQLHHKERIVSKLADATHEAIRNRLLVLGEIVGTKSMLTLESQGKRELDTVKTWPILEGFAFSEEDYAAVSKLSVSKIEKIIATRAGKGNGAAAKRKLAEQLERAGAVQINETLKVIERRL